MELFNNVDAALDGIESQLSDLADQLLHYGRGKDTDTNVQAGNAASALSRARRLIQEAQYYLTKED